MRKCDIVMVSWNQLVYTKRCIKSIMEYTDVESRLIIVDNGSNADTKEYLRSLKENRFVELKVIFNNSNLGAIKARNQGMRELDADHLCLIDNDIEVTPRWLSRMIELTQANPEIGVVNPSSNNFGQIPPPGVSLNDYATTLEVFKRKYIEVGQGISFCMLIKREVVEKIGYLDEDLEIMLYEDTDYSMRANKEGYRCVIAKDVYVWHHGHKTSGHLKHYKNMSNKNRGIFYKKWGRPLRILWCTSTQVESENFKDCLTSSIKLARDGNYIYLFILERPSFNREGVFKRAGLIEHANVHFIFQKGFNFKWSCLWRVLKKRKKKYDLVVTNSTNIAGLIKRFEVFHKAKVLTSLDFDAILETVHNLKFS